MNRGSAETVLRLIASCRFWRSTVPYEKTVVRVRQALSDIFAEVDCWFDRPEDLHRFKPPVGVSCIDQILEHITLTNYFLMLVIRRWTEKAARRAQRGETIPEGESDLDLKQAKFPSPQGIYLLVDDDAPSLSCPRTGS
jgi:hypothetical protein